MDRWAIRKTDTIFSSRVFVLKKLTCAHPGKEEMHDFYILNCPDWINVVALTDEGKFIFVRQHRLGTDEETLETPAGLIEPGEDPLVAAERELLEETGHRAERIVLMKKLAANPAIQNNWIYFYRAEGCRRVAAQSLDRAEDIEIDLFDAGEVRAMTESGKISHSIIVTALNLYFNEKAAGK